MSVTPCSSSFVRNRHRAPLGHAGAALRARVAQHEHRVGGDVERGIVDPRRDVVDVLEHERGAAMAVQGGRRSRSFDHRAVRGEAPAQHGESRLLRERRRERRDHRGIMVLGRLVAARERGSGDRQRVAMEQRVELAQERRDAAGAMQILDQPLAGRSQVGDPRRRPRDLVEASERERHSDSTREREQMDDGVRAAADRHQQRDRVVERGRGQDLRRAQPFPRDLDRAAPRRLAGPVAGRVHGGDRCGSRQRHAERLDERRHRRGRAELVAVPGGGFRRRLQLVELLLAHAPGAQHVGVVPEVGSGAELAAAEDCRLGRAARQRDRGNVDARGPHQLGGNRLVAARRSARSHRAGTTGSTPRRPST